MFRVGGDFKKVDSWAKAMGTAPGLLDQMSRQMAEEAVGLIADGFRAQSDPYGRKWRPKKVPDGRNVLVGKTANLRTGWNVTRSTRGGFTVSPSVSYAVHHQFGAPRARIPARMMFPSTKLGLPPAWRDALTDVIQEQLSAHFGGGGARNTRTGGVGFVKGKLAGVKRRLNVAALLRKLLRNVSGE
jgi:phage gpG-like protein